MNVYYKLKLLSTIFQPFKLLEPNLVLIPCWQNSVTNPGGLIARNGTSSLVHLVALAALETLHHHPISWLLCYVVVLQSLSHGGPFVTPWTAACQASLSFTISRSLLKLMSIELVVPPNHLILCRPLLLPSGGSFPASGSFQVSQFFASRGQSIRASASASVLPVNIQDWFPLGWTGWISFQSKGLSRVFSNATVQKHQFFGTQPYLWSNSHIHTWLLDKPQLWLDGPLSAKECLCFLICCLGWS